MGKMICTIDLETSGFDKVEDHITEIAWTIKPHGVPRSLVDKRYYIKGVETIPQEVIDLTGIQVGHCNRYGREIGEVTLELLLDIRRTDTEYMAAHNGRAFDKPFLLEKAPRTEELPPWLDTYTDIEWPENYRCHQLGHLCAELGFINPFPHNGLSDVWAAAKLLDQFPLDRVIARSKEPTIVVYADVSFDDKELAKADRFRWEGLGDKKYKKSWVKSMKKSDYDSANYKYPTKVIDTWE